MVFQFYPKTQRLMKDVIYCTNFNYVCFPVLMKILTWPNKWKSNYTKEIPKVYGLNIMEVN